MAEHDASPTPPAGWEIARSGPRTLFKRFVFERYAHTRDFVDALSALAQREGWHPQNINFGGTYVNVTLDPAPDGSPDVALAARVDALLPARQG